MSLIDVEQLREIAEVEFADIVVEAIISDLNELRIILTDGSFVDVWFSLKLQGRYSFHWNDAPLMGGSTATITRRTSGGNPVATFPRHVHDGDEMNVSESHLSEVPEQALREFLAFVQVSLGASSSGS